MNKITDILNNISKVFLDTAPLIYYIEGSTNFFSIVDVFFQGLKSRNIPAIVSPITLAECLVMPVKLNQAQIQKNFIDFLTNNREIEMVCIDSEIAVKASELRSIYGLKLPDALQIATAILSQCDAFLTNDAGLKRVTELQILVVGELRL